MTPQIVVGSLDDLKGRVKTYLGMAKPSDPRNQAFLRTAWRTERDPAVRAVIANALYVSDPQDYLAQRTLLDSFLATQDVFGRLQKVAEQLGVEVPGVASVLDLAAEGNPDALARAVELSHAGKGDGVRKEIDQGLAEVARAAADELLAALRHAAPTDREAALSGLARGLVLEADPDQPFWPALKKELGAPDPESAAFAREVESTLSLKIAAEKAPKAAVAVPPPPAAPPPSGAPSETRPGG
jgi:D-alanyl-D-alanine carboxypeptidase/D-alanyl-D-alanine-endopeptidase (penicillin-binding protein 4)